MRRVLLAVGDHHTLYLVGAVLTLAHDRHQALTIESVLDIELLQPLEERQAHRILRPCRSLRSQRTGRYGILVANVVAGKVSEALLAAADKFSLALILAYDARNVLESRKTVVALDAETVGHGVCHKRRHDRLDNILVAVQLAALGPASQLIAHQQHQSLVAVQQYIFTLAITQRNAYTVRVGIRRKHQIGTLTTTQIYGHRHGLALLGIRRLDSGEVAVDYGLLGYHYYIGEPEIAQRCRNKTHAGAVQRRVDDLHVVILGHALGRELHVVLDAVEIYAVEILAQNLDIRCVGSGLHLRVVGDLLDLGYDVGIMRGGHLCAVRPIGLVTVILLGVVRGRYDNARMTLELAYGEAQFGCGTQRVEQVYMEAVRGENIGHTLGKHTRIVTAVVRHGNTYRLAREVLLKVVRKALRSGAHRVDVHTVRTHTHDAAQAARTELEILVETLGQLLFIVIDQILDLFFRSFVIIAVEPFPGF